jgi:hypothetical protein
MQDPSHDPNRFAFRTILEVAPWEISPGGPVAADELVALLAVTDRHWLLYRVGDEGLGGQVAKGETIDAVNLNAKASHVPLMLTRFSSRAGNVFWLGSSGAEVVYDSSTTRSPNPTTLTLVDLATGRQQTLPATALHGLIVRFAIEGHFDVIHLRQVPSTQDG